MIYLRDSYKTPTNTYISSFSGKLVAPTLPGAATYYLWPGLQPPDNAGVLQQVLDGRSGEWWIGSGWCCSNPSLSWGSGFNGACARAAGASARAVTERARSAERPDGLVLEQGQQHRRRHMGDVAYDGRQHRDGLVPAPYVPGAPVLASANARAAATHPMNQAIMAIELYDVSWTFGAFAFENVVIVSVLPLRVGADVEPRADREHLLDCVVHQRAD
jgi:hypothetical protein